MLKAYRWQYIVSGVMEPRFQKVLFGVLDDAQAARIQAALAPLTYAVPQPAGDAAADGGLNRARRPSAALAYRVKDRP